MKQKTGKARSAAADVPMQKTASLSLDEAAKRSGYSEDYLRSLIRQGKLEARKLEGRWVVAEQTMHRYGRENRGGRKNRLFTPEYVRQHFDRLYMRIPTVLMGLLSLLLMVSLRASPYFNNTIYTYVQPGSSATMQLVALGHKMAEPALTPLNHLAVASFHHLEVVGDFGAELYTSLEDMQRGFSGALFFTSSVGAQSADLYIAGAHDFFKAVSKFVIAYTEGLNQVAAYTGEGVMLVFHQVGTMAYGIAQFGQALAGQALIATEDIFRVTGQLAFFGAEVGARIAQNIISFPAQVSTVHANTFFR